MTGPYHLVPKLNALLLSYSSIEFIGLVRSQQRRSRLAAASENALRSGIDWRPPRRPSRGDRRETAGRGCSRVGRTRKRHQLQNCTAPIVPPTGSPVAHAGRQLRLHCRLFLASPPPAWKPRPQVDRTILRCQSQGEQTEISIGCISRPALQSALQRGRDATCRR